MSRSSNDRSPALDGIAAAAGLGELAAASVCGYLAVCVMPASPDQDDQKGRSRRRIASHFRGGDRVVRIYQTVSHCVIYPPTSRRHQGRLVYVSRSSAGGSIRVMAVRSCRRS